MTDTSGHDNGQAQPSRLEQIEALLLQTNASLSRVAQQQDRNTEALAQLSQEVRELTSDATRVLGRSAILDDVLLELRESQEQHQRNFEEHQRTTNAALNQLGAILAQLTRIDPQN
jgi:chromosome segregation ATPase